MARRTNRGKRKKKKRAKANQKIRRRKMSTIPPNRNLKTPELLERRRNQEIITEKITMCKESQDSMILTRTIRAEADQNTNLTTKFKDENSTIKEEM